MISPTARRTAILTSTRRASAPRSSSTAPSSSTTRGTPAQRPAASSAARGTVRCDNRNQMAKETLFHLLSRQPWWVTLLVAFVVFWIGYSIFPPVAPFIVLPFIVLAIYIGYQQFRKGSPGNVGERL